MYEFVLIEQIIDSSNHLYREFIFASVRVFSIILLFYFTIYFLFEKIYLKSKSKLFFLYVLLSIVACTYLMLSLNYLLYWKAEGETNPTWLDAIGHHPKSLKYFLNISFVLAMASLFYFINKWNVQEKKRKELESLQHNLELQQLRSQLQPHFLFNTLNNIHALSEQNSPKTSQAIIQLSKLLENSIYNKADSWGSLEKEIEYVSSYIELEKLRYGDRINIAINIFCETEDKVIPSLILLPLVENTFKHGLSHSTEPGFITIEVNTENDYLVIKIENSLPSDYESTSKNSRSLRGIGIQNVKRRMELLCGKDSTFEILNNVESFLVILKFKLSIKDE